VLVHPFIKLGYVLDFVVETAKWSELTTEQVYAIMKLRTNVFYAEQQVDDEELDGRDLEPECEHYWIADDTGVLSYARVLFDDAPTDRDARHVVGRVVTRADARGKGLASQVLHAAIQKHAHEPMVLHAQSYAVPLYAKLGFEKFGEPYLEAGIPHVSMYRAGDHT
jgi:ElaA protein